VVSRLGASLALFTAVCVVACGSGTPTPSPTPDALASVRVIARGSVTDILGGASTTPFLTNWPTIQSRTLPALQKTQFCKTLELPFADKIIGGMVSVGLNALSLALRRKPAPEETKSVVDFVAEFAVKTCPQWDPTRPSTQTPKPFARWYPLGYIPLLADPGVAWRWAKDKTPCATGTPMCWHVDVVARDGCPTSLFMAVAGLDSEGIVIDPGEGDIGPIAANTPIRVELTPEVAGVRTPRVDFISCS